MKKCRTWFKIVD